jgi:exodeoxyribonuclease-3
MKIGKSKGYHCNMRIITLNVNGIRSANKRGLFPWLAQQDADVVCLQETRALEHQWEDPSVSLPGYLNHLYAAERPGYSGVAVLSRREPDRVLRGFKIDEFDREGRYLELQFDALSVISLYLPSGSAGPERQASKFRFLEAFMPHLRQAEALQARIHPVR